jgi:hypothetical protein
MSHPGRHFVRAVQDADWTKSDPISPFSISAGVLASIRDSFEDIRSPHELIDTSSFDAIDVIESYVRREIICPLLNLRIRYGSEVFTEPDEYFRRIDEFPKPIMTIYLDDFTTPQAVDDLILWKWVEFCMLVTILEQLLNKATVISCPRAYSLVPGFSFFQMAKSGDCDQYVRNRECMVWSKGRLGNLPQCVFRNSIGLLGLERP